MDTIDSTGDSCSMRNTSLEIDTVIEHPVNNKVEAVLTRSDHNLESTQTKKKKKKKKKKKVSENDQNTQIDVQGDTASTKDEDGPTATNLCQDSRVDEKRNASVTDDNADCPPAESELVNTATDEKTNSKVTPDSGLAKSKKKKKKKFRKKKKLNASAIDDNFHASHAELELPNAADTDEKADSEMAPSPGSSESRKKKKRRKHKMNASVANDNAEVPLAELELINTVNINEKEDSKTVSDSGSKKSQRKKKRKLNASISGNNGHVPLTELEVTKMDENALVSEQRIYSREGQMHDNNDEDDLVSTEKENIQFHQKKGLLKNNRKRKGSSNSEENAEPDTVARQASLDSNRAHSSGNSENEVERMQAGDRAPSVKIEENVSTEVVPSNCSTGDLACTSNRITERKQDDNKDLHIKDYTSQVARIPGGSSLGRPNKKLLILDVNGLLADILPYGQISDKADIIISHKSVFKRPFCDDFLQFCFEKFNVGVWSSRTKKNVDKVIDFLMGDSIHKLLFVWHQSHCTDTGFTTVENSSKPLLFKELRKLWDKYDPRLPFNKGDYDESNTLLLDDSPYKALRNPPHTAIFPHTYHYKDAGDCSLGPGGDLRVYLERCAEAENVQEFVAQNPFGQRAITESNPSWGFYQKLLNVSPYQSKALAGGSGKTW